MSRPIYASDSNTITPLFRPIFANTALKNECDFWIYFRIFFFPANSTQKRFAQCLDSWSSLFHEKFQCTLKYESVGKLVKRLITVEQCMGCPSFSCALFC